MRIDYLEWLTSLSEEDVNAEKDNLTNLLKLVNQKLHAISIIQKQTNTNTIKK